jgi:hypothetical protein
MAAWSVTTGMWRHEVESRSQPPLSQGRFNTATFKSPCRFNHDPIDARFLQQQHRQGHTFVIIGEAVRLPCLDMAT